jgi:hypothetical protein
MDFGPKQMGRILEIVDGLGIHREAVSIPLAPEGEGVARIAGARLEIRRPETGDFEAWLAGLPDAIRALDTSSLKKVEPGG